jgi:glycosyltransferase involved in cell wall biosynthesis
VKRLLDHLPGHREFWKEDTRTLTFKQRFFWELQARKTYQGVRKARAIICLSETMAREVNVLYRRPAEVLRGAYHSEIFDFIPQRSINKDLGLEPDSRIILNINRLDPRKRVDLIIRAFADLPPDRNHIYLVIGGTGTEKATLEALVAELNIDNVIFLGFIPEERLLDYYATCDLFVHPNWADYAITVYEALALGKKVLVSSEMDFEEDLLECSQIHQADPRTDKFTEALDFALDAENDNPIPRSLLERYTWKNYFRSVNALLEEPVTA